MADSLNPIDVSQRNAAKVAALASLISFAVLAYTNFGMRGPLFASGDTAEYVQRIVEAAPVFRLSVAFDFVYCTGVVVLLAALYVVLSPVNRYLALLASLLKLIYAVTAVLMALNFLTIVRLASDAAYVQALEPVPLQALVRLTSSAAWDRYYLGLAFWAVASTVLGWLWLKSRYIPAVLAVFGLLSSAWCLVCTLAYIINPAFSSVVNVWAFDSPMALFDIILSFWLLFKGLRDPAAPGVAYGR